MIRIIYGEKGTGKTKIMLDSVNEIANTAKGDVVFISQKKGYSANIDFNVRCIYTEDFDVRELDGLIGFVDGLMAGNSDIEYIFLDGIMRIADCSVDDIEEFICEAKKLEKDYGVNFVITVSCAKDNLPPFIAELCD